MRLVGANVKEGRSGGRGEELEGVKREQGKE